MALDRTAAISRLIDNYLRQLTLLTEVISNQTQSNVDAVIAAAGLTNLIQFKITSSLDGESYDWTGYQAFLTKQLADLRKLEISMQSPFEIRTRAVPS